jgi:hypothetical protein
LEFYRFVFAGQHFEVVSCTSDGAGVQCWESEPLDFVLVSQDNVSRQRCVLHVALLGDVGCSGGSVRHGETCSGRW